METHIALSVLAAAAALLYGIAIAGELAIPTAGRNEMRALDEVYAEKSAGRYHTRHVTPVEQLLEDPGRFLTTMLVLKTMALIMLGVGVARLLPAFVGIWPILIVVLVVGLAMLLGNAAARNWILARPALVAVRLAPTLLMLTRVLFPITFVVRAIGKRNRPEEEELLPDDVLLSENGLRLLMGIGGEEGPILESEKEMIASILEMDETAAREVMVPRMDMVALNVETTLTDALDVIMEVGHSRIPIYEDNIDKIVGILYAKDLLLCYRENRSDASIRSLMRSAHFVPLSKKVNMLLRDMQKHRVHIAMVVDEYGGTAGLVTIEDILEEIVGDIQDEYDMGEESYIEMIGPDSFLLNSRLDLYSVAKLLDVELADEDADTLGGLIYSTLGHVPAQGETVDLMGWQFTVLGIDGNRIDQVRADRNADPEIGVQEKMVEATDAVARSNTEASNTEASGTEASGTTEANRKRSNLEAGTNGRYSFSLPGLPVSHSKTRGE